MNHAVVGTKHFIWISLLSALTAVAQEAVVETPEKADGISEVAAPSNPLESLPAELDTPSRDTARQSRLTLGGRYSSEVQEYLVDALAPIWHSGDAMIALNVRGTFLESDEQEVNVGLVARRFLDDPSVILGANLYYDNRWTENNNTFDQVGGGVEVLSTWVDFRANVYVPLTSEEVISATTETDTSVAREPGRTVTTTRSTRMTVYEEALQGYDAELGVWLPFLDQVAPTALYVGYYDFSSDYEEDQSGMKARLESRLTSQLTLDAEWYENDQLNRTDYFVGIRVQVPLDFWNGLKIESAPAVNSLQGRMTEMVHRDFRIRTLVTSPVETSEVTDEQVQSTSTQTSSSRSSTPAPVEPEPEPPNCSIDPITGDVVCL